MGRRRCGIPLKIGNTHPASSFAHSGLPRGLLWEALQVTPEKLRWPKAEGLLFSPGFEEFCNAFTVAATCHLLGVWGGSHFTSSSCCPQALHHTGNLRLYLCKFQLLTGGQCYNIWEVSVRGLAALTHFGQKFVLPWVCFVPVLYGLFGRGGSSGTSEAQLLCCFPYSLCWPHGPEYGDSLIFCLCLLGHTGCYVGHHLGSREEASMPSCFRYSRGTLHLSTIVSSSFPCYLGCCYFLFSELAFSSLISSCICLSLLMKEECLLIKRR